MLDPATKALCGEFKTLPTAIVGDTLRQMGFHHQILSAQISGLERGMTLAGPAFCVRGEPVMGAPEKPAAGATAPRFKMLSEIYAGCVLVYATGGFNEAATWGENINIAAQMKGCSGAVVDGGVRDAKAIIDSGMPVFARFITPVSSAPRFKVAEWQVPITISGQVSQYVSVQPGDIILGDFDGVAVVPARAASACLEAAQEVHRIEQAQRVEFLRGDEAQAVYGRYDRFGHIKKWNG